MSPMAYLKVQVANLCQSTDLDIPTALRGLYDADEATKGVPEFEISETELPGPGVSSTRVSAGYQGEVPENIES